MSDHIVFSFILISLCFLMFKIRNYRKSKSGQTHRLNKLTSQLASHKICLSVMDCFEEKVLGFDVVKDKVVYLDHESNVAMIIDLDAVGNCTLIKKQVTIQLELIFQDQNKDPLTITFYNKFRDRKWRRGKLEKKAIYWNLLMNSVLDKRYDSLESSKAKDFE